MSLEARVTGGQREEGSGPTEREVGKRVAIEVRGAGSGCAGEKKRWGGLGTNTWSAKEN